MGSSTNKSTGGFHGSGRNQTCHTGSRFELVIWHLQRAGVVLNVRVIDGENAGKTGYVLASWLNFTDRSTTNSSIGQPGTTSVGKPGKIISIRPTDLAEDDATTIIRAASEAIMQAHPDTEVDKEHIFITDSTQQGAYDISLPVHKKVRGRLWVLSGPAKCTVRRVGGKWTAELIYFPNTAFDLSGVK